MNIILQSYFLFVSALIVIRNMYIINTTALIICWLLILIMLFHSWIKKTWFIFEWTRWFLFISQIHLFNYNTLGSWWRPWFNVVFCLSISGQISKINLASYWQLDIICTFYLLNNFLLMVAFSILTLLSISFHQFLSNSFLC